MQDCDWPVLSGGPKTAGSSSQTLLAWLANSLAFQRARRATVERLFSVVGMAFADKRKSAHAEALAELAFIKLNLETNF